ncbi:hypothetical protein Cgig2_024010 [Carnegiea gigantea]|uniref:DUF4005 domain-containing protein n=1 Tax=Carnegiea gigantea TaxID=171969 RepID=A0A9Q1KC56_9CARY|nr:hypothetical protein Cgig2_024010 [Carnegiea gigantea]
MGRATRWLKSLLGMKKQQPEKGKSQKDNGKEKVGEKGWSFNKAEKRENENQWLRDYITENEDEQSKHAIAVAAASAAAADAAVAAAQAAVTVVRLTAQNRDALFLGGREKWRRDRWAAVKIQTLFRGYLARKALRALKALVKLQAHVRGFLVRKRARATLHSMQALIRAQAAVRCRRANLTPMKTNKFQSEFRSRRSTGRLDETRSEFHSKRISTSYDPNNANEGSPKIVEVDTCKPRSTSRRFNPSLYDFTSEDFLQYPTMSSPLPCPAPGQLSMPYYRDIYHHDYNPSRYADESRISTAQSTPRFANSIRSNGLITPTKSVCGESFRAHHSNCPNYMAETHSFRAKLRAQSVPKQRPDARPRKKLSLSEIMEARNSYSGVRMHRSGPQVQGTLNF